MSGIPWHPLVVHFPVGLVVLLPISVVVAILVIRKGATPRRVWSVPVAVAAATRFFHIRTVLVLATSVAFSRLVSAQLPREGQMSHIHSHGVTLEIPESMRIEHGEIHAALERATGVPGRVGEAARALAAVLHPHFEREEEIALPPLGLLLA